MGKIIDFKTKLVEECSSDILLKYDKNYEDLSDFEVRYLLEKYRITINKLYELIQLLTTVSKSNTKNINTLDSNIATIESWKNSVTTHITNQNELFVEVYKKVILKS
mgnify:CR=1 FL=1|tara:strand:- start:8171 stop:8491 length:321 start_codon:yes stop_codon:yes gene_type:complete